MQFFNFTLRFGQVSWGLKVPLRTSEEIRRNTQAIRRNTQKHPIKDPKQKHPKQKPLRFAYGLRVWTYRFQIAGRI